MPCADNPATTRRSIGQTQPPPPSTQNKTEPEAQARSLPKREDLEGLEESRSKRRLKAQA